jgi:hypothetical protein
MSYEFYRVLHLVGIFALLLSLGGTLLHTQQGGLRYHLNRSWLMMFHGAGLLIIFVAGFGLIAKTHVGTPWPGWLWCKLLIWLLLGMMTVFIQRLPAFTRALWFVVLGLGGLAAYFALYKPF